MDFAYRDPNQGQFYMDCGKKSHSLPSGEPPTGSIRPGPNVARFLYMEQTEWDSKHEIAGPGQVVAGSVTGSDYKCNAESERKRVQCKGLTFTVFVNRKCCTQGFAKRMMVVVNVWTNIYNVEDERK